MKELKAQDLENISAGYDNLCGFTMIGALAGAVVDPVIGLFILAYNIHKCTDL